jgi:hypothetical protein
MNHRADNDLVRRVADRDGTLEWLAVFALGVWFGAITFYGVAW